MVTLRRSKRKHVDICIEEESQDGEIRSKYFKKAAEVEKFKDEPSLSSEEIKPVDIEWLKSLNSVDYFKWVSEVTDDNPERWNKPLDPRIFRNRSRGLPPLPQSFEEIYTKVRTLSLIHI